jgi:FAD/FMN-containing dehydrogenase
MIDARTFRRWASAIRGSVLMPGDADYDTARQVWNRAIDRRPAAIVRCAGEEDVVRAIELARSTGVPLAVRAGGHSQAGHSVCEGGVLIDLSELTEIRVDPQRRLAHVQGGTRVGRLLDALQPTGLVTPTGGCPDVGVAGLTLGGGETFLSAAYGAACDNVAAVRVATADGRIVTASPEEHADLFWALRGGGGNFGVATAFELTLHPIQRVLFGRLTFPLPRTREVVRAYRDLVADAPDALQTSGGLLWSEDRPALFVALCYCGERGPGERLVDGWRARLRADADSIEWVPYTADLVLPPIASVGTGMFLDDLPDDAIDLLAECFLEAPPSCTAAWNDFHGAVTRVPVELTAFPLRRRGFDLFVHASWRTAQDRLRAVAWVERIRRGLDPVTRGVYVNNLGEGEEHRTAEAYGASYARLAAIKATYDPDNVFRLNHNIRPVGRRSA